MTMRRIEITDLRKAKSGDNSRWRDKNGYEYTGPLVAYGDTLMFAGVTVRYPDGTVPSDCWLTFVSATREVPVSELPTEPLSVITDVTTNNGGRHALGVRDCVPDGKRPWRLFDRYSSHIMPFNADEIESFTLAKVVPAKSVVLPAEEGDAIELLAHALHQECCNVGEEGAAHSDPADYEYDRAREILYALQEAIR